MRLYMAMAAADMQAKHPGDFGVVMRVMALRAARRKGEL